MLSKLISSLPSIIKLLEDPDRWDTLIVNRRKPVTYRLFTQMGNNRVCLHKFEKYDNPEEGFYHPHPWPAGFLILDGSYVMSIGSSPNLTDMPLITENFYMSKGSGYEIIHPTTWHAITPYSDFTYTIMMNGPEWPESIAHKSVRRTKGKDLEQLSYAEKLNQLAVFDRLLKEFKGYK